MRFSLNNFVSRNRKIFLFLLVFLLIFNFSNQAHAADGVAEYMGSAIINGLVIFFNQVQYIVFVLLSLLLLIAGSIFDWVINPGNFQKIVAENKAVVEGWRLVRDILNLSFILVLLFSAFSTVFQVEKYHIKKLWLTILIMALLVNFSFPISRFIIDTSNVIMYYFIGQVFPSLNQSSGMGAVFIDMFKVVDLIMPHGGFTGIMQNKSMVNTDQGMIDGSIDYTIKLVFTNFFIALFAITLTVLAVLFLIRTIVLAILVMFSPVGFVASILPSTASYANQWWDQLFRQSFFGPIMMFMIIISIKTMDSLGDDVMASDIFGNSEYSIVLVTGARMMIPLVLLWVGMISAQKIGAAGSDAVVGQAKKAAIFAGKGILNSYTIGTPGTKFGFKLRPVDTFRGIQQGLTARMKSGTYGTDQGDLRAAQITSGISGDRTILEAQRAKLVKEAAERHDFENKPGSYTQGIANDPSKDIYERAAAIQALANDGEAEAEQLAILKNQFGADSAIFRKAVSKMKSANPTIAFAHLSKEDYRKELKDYLISKDFDFKKLSDSALKDEELVAEMLENKVVSMKDISELKGAKSNNFKGAIEFLAKNSNNSSSEHHKSIHMANFAMNGEINTDNASFADHIAENLNKDTAKNMKPSAISGLPVEKMKKSNIKETVYAIKNEEATEKLVEKLKQNNAHKEYVNNHPDLKNFSKSRSEENETKKTKPEFESFKPGSKSFK